MGNGYAANFEPETAWQPDQNLGLEQDAASGHVVRRKRGPKAGPKRRRALPVESEKRQRVSGNSAGEERAAGGGWEDADGGGLEDADGDGWEDHPQVAQVYNT